MITLHDNADKKRLLVIEDDKSLGEVLRYNFLSEGYEVKLINNGKDGLDFCLNWEADIIILDLMLPLINGIEICRNIHKYTDIYGEREIYRNIQKCEEI